MLLIFNMMIISAVQRTAPITFGWVHLDEPINLW